MPKIEPLTTLLLGDCREKVKELESESIDSIVTDPPYEIGFMGKSWDKAGVAFDPYTWKVMLDVCKPGAYMLCFGGTRTFHRIACAIEDAGWQIRDCIMWVYGSGFPKGKGNLKPAWEPIILARKSGPKVLPLGIDDCRVPCNGSNPSTQRRKSVNKSETGVIDSDRWVDRRSLETYKRERPEEMLGRYPANLIHDGSEEVLEAFAAFGERKATSNGGKPDRNSMASEEYWGQGGGGFKVGRSTVAHGDTGTAARFFYCAKAGKKERGQGNNHPTVKPLKLIEYLVKLVTPPLGVVLDPFMGSGTTGMACRKLDRDFIGIELNEDYLTIAQGRIDSCQG